MLVFTWDRVWEFRGRWWSAAFRGSTSAGRRAERFRSWRKRLRRRAVWTKPVPSTSTSSSTSSRLVCSSSSSPSTRAASTDIPSPAEKPENHNTPLIFLQKCRNTHRFRQPWASYFKRCKNKTGFKNVNAAIIVRCLLPSSELLQCLSCWTFVPVLRRFSTWLESSPVAYNNINHSEQC